LLALLVQGVDEKGGLHLLSHWVGEVMAGEETKMRVSLGRKTYILDAGNAQELARWHEVFKPKAPVEKGSLSKSSDS